MKIGVSRSWVACLLTLALTSLLPSSVTAQLHKDTRLGYQFKPAKNFEAFPVQPNQVVSVARFKSTKATISGNQTWHNTMNVMFFPNSMVPEGDSREQYFEQLVLELEESEGYCEVDKDKQISVGRRPARERYLIPQAGELAVYQLLLDQEDGVFVFTGKTWKDRFKKDVKDLSKSAKSFKRIDKEAPSEENGERSQMTEQERFLQEQIDKLPRGWDSMRTDRYLFLFNAEKTFVKQMGDQIEAIRDTYEELYPPEGESFDDISIVRVCDSRQDYLGYGGSEGSGGYWSSGQRELVFFDMAPRSFTLAVLNHEAFHQYIYYFYGELAPHSWYNEGHGDYFAGAKLSRSYRVLSFGNAGGGIGRQEGVKKACMLRSQGKDSSDGAATALQDLMRYSQQEYYANGRVHYAQGWALVHMLRESKRLKPQWKRILPDYLGNLLEARLEVAQGLMLKAQEQYKKEPVGQAPSSDPEDYFQQANTNEIQDLTYEKTFGSWTDEDWDDFDAFYLKYVEKV